VALLHFIILLLVDEVRLMQILWQCSVYCWFGIW